MSYEIRIGNCCLHLYLYNYKLVEYVLLTTYCVAMLSFLFAFSDKLKSSEASLAMLVSSTRLSRPASAARRSIGSAC